MRYTRGMKTAVSIPDDLFARADRLARRAGKSRSRVYSEALREYLARHAANEVTAALNRVCDALGPGDSFPVAASRRTLARVEW